MRDPENGKIQALNFDDVIDDHILTSIETPLRRDAFNLDDELKIELIEKNFKEIMHILGLDLNDESLKGTPRRVAKMYVKEIFDGLNPENKPKPTMFENKYKFNEMLIEKDITIYSYCEHHFVPIIGKAHIAYFPKNHVIGLSKLNRIAQYFARRPQVQERLTVQIATELKNIVQSEDVAVIMDADHLCVASRGVNDVHSSTTTSSYHGKFLNDNIRQELISHIRKN
ncbi:GTP cyclohydrolase I FolE [bacterium BMS3Abin03]|jgi:GTP cyclohydrolase IA|nr:GTP cyclohydrolase I FolE [bacterium BMS3Abin03]MCG6960685.1 GTP cyclohydrolase I FolE [bacterium BMS3Abin03]